MELTTNISLHKIGYGEYPDQWDVLYNADQDILDAEIWALKKEMSGARGSTATSLKEKLDKAMYDDGTIKSSEEVRQARGTSDSLKDALALLSNDWTFNSINSAPLAGIFPDFMTYGSNLSVTINKNEGDIVFDIGGYPQIINANTSSDALVFDVPKNQNPCYVYATRGSDLTPVFGTSSSYGFVEDAVYFGEIYSSETAVNRVLHYSLKRRFESTWEELKIGGEKVVFYHYLGTSPKYVDIFLSRDGSLPYFIPSHERVLMSMDSKKATISLASGIDYVYVNNTVEVPTEETTSFVKIILRY